MDLTTAQSRGSFRRWWRPLGALVLTLGLALSGGASGAAEEQSPHKVTEFAVRAATGLQWQPEVSGRFAVWKDDGLGFKAVAGRNLETGLDFVVNTQGTVVWPVTASGDLLVTLETRPDNEFGIFGYRLPEGPRFEIATFRGGGGYFRAQPKASGNLVVWAEGTGNASDIYAYDLTAQRTFAISTNPAQQTSPAAGGNYVVWLDQRHTSANDYRRPQRRRCQDRDRLATRRGAGHGGRQSQRRRDALPTGLPSRRCLAPGVRVYPSGKP